MPVLINTEGSVIAALYLDLSSEVMARDIPGNLFWIPPSLLVSKTKLAIDVEAPSVEVS